MLPRYIYVPQSRAAIMTQNSLKNNILGLYSHDFTACVLAIFRNKKEQKMLYFHADWISVEDKNSIRDLTELLKKFQGDEANTITVEYWHKEGKTLTLTPLHRIISQFKEGSFEIERKKVSNEALNVGILSNLDKSFQIIPNNLANRCIFHPDHAKMKIIRRIEEIVTPRALKAKKAYARKTICVFEDKDWVAPLPLEYDLKVDSTHQEVLQDLQSLESLKNFKPLLEEDVLNVLKTIASRGLRFADIDKATKQLYPRLIDYFSIFKPKTVSVPISAQNKDYLYRLNDILGKDRKILCIDETAAKVSFFPFWLQQLDDKAITELSTELGVNQNILKS